MTTFLTPNAIPGVFVSITINGDLFQPLRGYKLGFLKPGDKVAITATVAKGAEHKCYTLDAKMTATPKAATHPGVYVKNLTITKVTFNQSSGHTRIAGWPNNMFCLEIAGKTYNIGVFNRHGQYFFAIHEKTDPIETNLALPVGFVTHSDPLRGVARVFTGSLFQETRLHWSKMPFRHALGFRAVIAGEVVTIKEIAKTGAEKTSFSQEIKSCALA
jgi:hypothetical protein